jgi:hydroxypyruvate isomerase
MAQLSANPMIRFSANLSLMFRELPLLERFDAARDGGFQAVEIQVPYEFPAETLARAADDAGMPVILINAPMGPDRTSPGMACRREHREIFRAELDRAAEYAHALRTPCINVLAGRAAPEERAECLQQLTEHLCLAAEVLGAAGARALLETVNPLDAPGYCVPSFELAVEVLSHSDRRVGLQFDVYHAARLGLQPDAAFAAVRDWVAHVQFADCPGRHEPGTGTLPFERIFHAIERSGYGGWVGAEYHPSGNRTADSLGWLRARGA